jgi:hypothetical protein
LIVEAKGWAKLAHPFFPPLFILTLLQEPDPPAVADPDTSKYKLTSALRISIIGGKQVKAAPTRHIMATIASLPTSSLHRLARGLPGSSMAEKQPGVLKS